MFGMGVAMDVVVLIVLVTLISLALATLPDANRPLFDPDDDSDYSDADE